MELPAPAHVRYQTLRALQHHPDQQGAVDQQLVLGELLEQTRLLGAAEALREAMGSPLPPCDRPDRERSIASLRARLDEDAFSAAWAEGRGMTWEEAVAYALGEPTDENAEGRGPPEGDQ